MTANDATRRADESLLAAKVRVPEHVVFRAFANETVILNLQTGRYHGLDAVGGRLLELFLTAPTLRDAANLLADEYGRPRAEVEADAADFCRSLSERGLVSVETA